MSTVFFNGQFIDRSEAHVSVDDRGFLFGDGVYEVVRSYAGRFFSLPEHLQRLRNGLRELSIVGVDTADPLRRDEDIRPRADLSNGEGLRFRASRITRLIKPGRRARRVEGLRHRFGGDLLERIAAVEDQLPVRRPNAKRS